MVDGDRQQLAELTPQRPTGELGVVDVDVIVRRVLGDVLGFCLVGDTPAGTSPGGCSETDNDWSRDTLSSFMDMGGGGRRDAEHDDSVADKSHFGNGGDHGEPAAVEITPGRHLVLTLQIGEEDPER